MFRIKLFQSFWHPLLKGQSIELTSPEETSVPNYYSLIIGPNGTGKSNLLKNVIEAFNEIALYKKDENYKPKKRFKIVYQLDDVEYSFSTEDREVKYTTNENSISKNSKLRLPSAWLASSVTLNDKYPILNYIRKKQIPEYKYLGIRSATNNAFISRITVNTVMHFLDALKMRRANKLLEVYKSLDLNPEVQIVFWGGPMLKLEKKEGLYRLPKSPIKLADPHISFLKKNKIKTNYRADNYKKHINDRSVLFDVLSFIQNNQMIFEKPSKAQMQLKYRINLESEEGIFKILSDWPILSVMLDLELIKISKFLLTKTKSFKYEEASSGESHLLGSLHGIIANIQNNTLVAIDEPEVSLHPNWQMDYIDTLKLIFDGFVGVNTIISSHSPFLVTSLKNEESRITSIRRNTESGEIEIDELDYETYGWDPEGILYNVFEVATLRNKYFELDLRKLIALITEKSTNLDEIRGLRNKVAKYVLPNENDPLKLLIAQVDQYLRK
jgi:predicted ATP-dependent endonuclease of OLD family